MREFFRGRLDGIFNERKDVARAIGGNQRGNYKLIKDPREKDREIAEKEDDSGCEDSGCVW